MTNLRWKVKLDLFILEHLSQVVHEISLLNFGESKSKFFGSCFGERTGMSGGHEDVLLTRKFSEARN